ncbi:MAG: Lrp/AsnC family transcriptional regulator [Candidimonas sp.]|nr:MAG: Lrp/AsnC family transcriptional regulator [Candidimonas sp.]TAM21245.1 MAG: Lrp/AsnC family transcriptional regulator [Candidimonas sp.]TAM80510.1 MAG: Lrp/AsnC family transcriptional regulator [Candidimonas sp.]
MVKLDRYDLQILKTLATQGRITKSDLAKIVCLSVSPTWERVKRLETLGLIRGYRAVIDWSSVFQSNQIIVEVRLDRHTASDMQRFEQRIAQSPEVTQCYATGGGVDYFVHVRARDIDHYQRFIDELLQENLGIDRYFTYIVTKIIKAGRVLPEEADSSE